MEGRWEVESDAIKAASAAPLSDESHGSCTKIRDYRIVLNFEKICCVPTINTLTSDYANPWYMILYNLSFEKIHSASILWTARRLAALSP